MWEFKQSDLFLSADFGCCVSVGERWKRQEEGAGEGMKG